MFLRNVSIPIDDNDAFHATDLTDTKEESIASIALIKHSEITLEMEIEANSAYKTFRGKWRNRRVAVKRFSKYVGIKKAKEYIDECAMKLLQNPHRNVLSILAYTTAPFSILTVYINYGSVKHFVSNKRHGSESISVLQRVHMAQQAAKGIEHLHSLGIIHSDIRCSNLLMEFDSGNITEIRIVVTDYSLHSLRDEMKNDKSLQYMAPEVIEDPYNISSKSDIYSLGITIWEIMTGEDPFSEEDPIDAAIHALISGRRPELYDDCIPHGIRCLMEKCWNGDKLERPNALYVVNQLFEWHTAFITFWAAKKALPMDIIEIIVYFLFSGNQRQH